MELKVSDEGKESQVERRTVNAGADFAVDYEGDQVENQI